MAVAMVQASKMKLLEFVITVSELSQLVGTKKLIGLINNSSIKEVGILEYTMRVKSCSCCWLTHMMVILCRYTETNKKISN